MQLTPWEKSRKRSNVETCKTAKFLDFNHRCDVDPGIKRDWIRFSYARGRRAVGSGYATKRQNAAATAHLPSSSKTVSRRNPIRRWDAAIFLDPSPLDPPSPGGRARGTRGKRRRDGTRRTRGHAARATDQSYACARPVWCSAAGGIREEYLRTYDAYAGCHAIHGDQTRADRHAHRARADPGHHRRTAPADSPSRTRGTIDRGLTRPGRPADNPAPSPSTRDAAPWR